MRRRQRDAVRRTWMTYSSVYHRTRNPNGTVLVFFIVGRCPGHARAPRAPARRTLTNRRLLACGSIYTAVDEIEEERQALGDVVVVSSDDDFNHVRVQITACMGLR
jgi:hypothetical protein